MPKFRVTQRAIKDTVYEVVVECADEGGADEAAAKRDDLLPAGFCAPDRWQTISIEQVSWNCVECGVEITKEQNRKGDEMCEKCVAAYDASEALSRG